MTMPTTERVTELDLVYGERAFRFLFAHATRSDQPVYYATVALAIGTHHRTVVRLMSMVEAFCNDHDLPSLSSFVITWTTGEVCLAYSRDIDPALSRRIAHEWAYRHDARDAYALADRWSAWSPRHV